MKLLLDTHALLWWFDGGDDLSPEAKDAIGEPTNSTVVSTATLWEISIKQSLGKLRIDGDLRQHMRDQYFEELPVVGDHAVAVRDLPLHHKDPFDRLLIAQARVEGLILVTADQAIAAYDVPVLAAR
ncbi:type II toxin-antitoxin system VapC family toxin [Actinocrispum wychmicini]|uniref:PIN domain nuclease of toxin-antitoxin system n=1 Tax=Actinocrispum wychmicini TaxID=1213861 RepID=A0A4R2JD52_9PSEU|nr:type II toxin-antitoxin system VapC family toxin [Actinocrispum wychmicini]TCO56844.1 PIN domain nuclease of toxin-antitoxin system [Actinocrispum wychmicini]